MSNLEPLKCPEVYRYLIEQLDEELDQPSRAAIRHHLDNCADCSAVLKSLKATITLYRSSPRQSVPRRLQARVLETIRTYAKKSERKQNRCLP